VPIVGVNPATLPRWTQWSLFGFSDRVVVKGRWNGAAIEVTEVGPFKPPPFVEKPLECDARTPARGRVPASEMEYEAALVRLSSMVYGNPDLYAGYWPLADRVVVVGTVGDPAQLWPRIEAAFPFSMCVINVSYSQTELNAAEEQIQRADQGWITTVLFERNRVGVMVPLVDSQTLSVLDRFPAAVPNPLVERLTP
jgi:hypothetical protein